MNQTDERETYTEELFDNVTLPFSLIREYIRAANSAGSHLSPDIAAVLLDFAERHLKELADALNAHFGNIEIIHDQSPDSQIFPWGKVVGISIRETGTGTTRGRH